MRYACAVIAIHVSGGLAHAQDVPASDDRELARRAAYEGAYRDCRADSVRVRVREGATASDVAREYVSTRISAAGAAVLRPGEPRQEWDREFAGCLAAVSGSPSEYDPAARADQAERTAARRRSAGREGTLGSYAWVFYLDVVLGVLLFAAGAASRHRDDSAALRRWWVVAAVLIGAFFGAGVFVAVGITATMPLIMSQPSEWMFAAMTTIAIAFGALGFVAAPRRRRR